MTGNYSLNITAGKEIIKVPRDLILVIGQGGGYRGRVIYVLYNNKQCLFMII